MPSNYETDCSRNYHLLIGVSTNKTSSQPARPRILFFFKPNPQIQRRVCGIHSVDTQIEIGSDTITVRVVGLSGRSPPLRPLPPISIRIPPTIKPVRYTPRTLDIFCHLGIVAFIFWYLSTFLSFFY